jgi:hypothetical protein
MSKLERCGGNGTVCSEEICVFVRNIHCKEPMLKIRNKYSQKKELRGHSPDFHIHVSVRDLYISTIDLPILLQENMWTNPGII